jgi:hypothetical protein
MNSMSVFARSGAIRCEAKALDRYTTLHPRLTIAFVLVLGSCAEWLAETAAALILRAVA